MGHFEELKVWQEAKNLAVNIYRLTNQGQLEKDFGLKHQIQRATVSVASNIAEGDESGSDKNSIRYFNMAKASSAELLTQLIIAKEIGYIDDKQFSELRETCHYISASLKKLINYRKSKLEPKTNINP